MILIVELNDNTFPSEDEIDNYENERQQEKE